MAFYHRKLWQQKPRQWGSYQRVQWALKDRFENMLGIPFDRVIIAMPHWEKSGKANSYGSITGWGMTPHNWDRGTFNVSGVGQVSGPNTEILQNHCWSIFFDAKFTGNVSASSAYIYEFGGISGGDYFQIKLSYAEFKVGYYNDFTGVNPVVNSVTNKRFTLAWSKGSATNHKGYYDGERKFTDSTTSIGIADSHRTDFFIHSDSENSVEIHGLYVFTHTLTDLDVDVLHRSQYQLWQRPVFRTYVDLATVTASYPKNRVLKGPFWGPFGGSL